MAPVTHAAQVQLSTGAEYSSGDYGDLTSTDAFVIPFSARVSFGSLSLRASIPVLSIRGPANISPVVDDNGGDRGSNSGSGSGDSGSSGSGSSGGSGSGSSDGDGSGSGGGGSDDFADNRSVTGPGDATLSATWGFRDLGDTRFYLDLTGRVRLPTGNKQDGLGRGTTDFSTLGEFGWDGNRGGIFLIGGRQFLESTGTLARRDVWLASGGYWINFGRRSGFGMQGNWREATTAGGTAPRSVDLFVNLGVGDNWRIDLNGSAGLSNASADYAVGAGIAWRSGHR